MIAPLSTAIIFFENEFGSFAAIIHMLACWVRSRMGQKSRYQPCVVIVCDKEITGLPRDLESRMTAEILTVCNPARELTAKDARAIWRGNFSSFVQVIDQDKPDWAAICRQATMAARGAACPALSETRLVYLLRTGCTQFSVTAVRIFNIIQASRTKWFPDEMPLQIQTVYESVRDDTRILVPAGILAASALAFESYSVGLGADFDPEHVFDELYWPLFDRLRKGLNWQTFTSAVRRGFIAYTYQFREQDPLSTHCDTLLKAGRSLQAIKPPLNDLSGQQICLSCLSYTPSNTLSCGHQICERCIDLHSCSSGLLPQCLLCGVANSALVRAKPPTAGVRVLSLSGEAADAPAMARFLQCLRSKLRIPLYQHFDLLMASGIGIFFTIMIFCKQASVEDCIHHLPRVKYIKVREGEFRFSRKLRFSRKELHSNLVRITLNNCNPQAEAERFWPGSKIDAFLEYCGRQSVETELLPAADNLLASLFYLEVLDLPLFFAQPTTIVVVAVKCRIPPGPDLANLALRMRASDTKVVYSGQEETKVSVLCSSVVWDRIRDGQPFQRLLHIRVASTRSLINVVIGSRTVSNCPRLLEDFVAESQRRVMSAGGKDDNHDTDMHGIVERLEQMGSKLRQLL
ncbi:hypothetical protein VM1G_00665 [Cytospora mali]|uniref:RING-type domain-containing protein n=1 Tax=Cytospora mali TaxID=578113 RepID=A0A194VMA6_CYTMA|nr:hypothetical protein VM1G_00665 [Valsa mali]